MAIKNIRDMRKHALQTIEQLEEGSCDIKTATAHSALYSSVIATIKSEMDYYKMIDKKPRIEFLEGAPIYEGEKLVNTSSQKFIEALEEDEDE